MEGSAEPPKLEKNVLKFRNFQGEEAPETMSEMRGFKMGSLNINSLVKHINELRVAMINQSLDILAINESKLGDNDCDNMLSLHGYTLVGRDRNKKGGGVCVYLRDSLYHLKDYMSSKSKTLS